MAGADTRWGAGGCIWCFLIRCGCGWLRSEGLDVIGVVVDWLSGFRCGCCMRRTAILRGLSRWWRGWGRGRRRRNSGFTLGFQVLRMLHIDSGVAVGVGDELVSWRRREASWS